MCIFKHVYLMLKEKYGNIFSFLLTFSLGIEVQNKSGYISNS